MSNTSGAAGVPSPDPTDLSYPIGRFQSSEAYAPLEREHALETLGNLPTRLYNAVDGLSESQLDTPYRPGGWTVRQVVHHLADSHMQAFLRIRYALTEAEPLIKVYDEKAWAELPDSKGAPVEWSMELIEALHARWVSLLQRLNPEQWQCAYVHPENGRTTIEQAVHLYAWHSRHHVAHMTHLRSSRNW